MSNSYNSLSIHLKTTFKSINEDVEITNESLITEGIFDSIKDMFKGGKAPSGKQEGEAKKLFGWFAGFSSIFVKSSDDPLLKKYNDIAEKEAKDEEDRLVKEYESKYGKICLGINDNFNWEWINSPWPWEGSEF